MGAIFPREVPVLRMVLSHGGRGVGRVLIHPGCIVNPPALRCLPPRLHKSINLFEKGY